MTAHSTRKGKRKERELVAIWRRLGFEAYRVPLSGAGEGFPGDVLVRIAGKTYRNELKARRGGEGFKTLERWLGDNHFLVLWRNRQEPIFVMPRATLESLLDRERWPQ